MTLPPRLQALFDTLLLGRGEPVAAEKLLVAASMHDRRLNRARLSSAVSHLKVRITPDGWRIEPQRSEHSAAVVAYALWHEDWAVDPPGGRGKMAQPARAIPTGRADKQVAYMATCAVCGDLKWATGPKRPTTQDVGAIVKQIGGLRCARCGGRVMLHQDAAA